MKPLLPFIIATLCIVQVQAQAPKASPAQLAETLYRQAQVAEKNGDVTTARQAYSDALKANPTHANARYRLGQLRINEPMLLARARESKFGAVKVPEINLDAASLQESIDALSIIVQRESKKSVTPNFVIQDPKAKLASPRISLNLKNMPAGAVLKYLMEQSEAKVRFDEHAIVIEPK